jgi:hypothetical protein
LPKYTTLRYFERSSSFEYWWASFTAMMASLILRANVRWFPVYTFFTYCCVIVDPPWTTLRWVRSSHAARTIENGLMPPS